MKIAILGAGAFGTALGGILTNNGHVIEYYDPKMGYKNLAEAVNGADFLLLCTPSDVVPQLLPDLPLSVPLIVATKGFLNDGLFVPFNDYMILSGPGFADDIKSSHDTYLTITDDRISQLLESNYMHFDKTNDKAGVLMCGALKNVYAIGAGIMELERNTDEWQNFIDSAADEMRRILTVNGSDATTVNLFCGLPDLKLTCGHPSRNYEFGEKLRLLPNYRPEKTVEGLSTIDRILHGEIKVPENTAILSGLLNTIVVRKNTRRSKKEDNGPKR